MVCRTSTWISTSTSTLTRLWWTVSCTATSTRTRRATNAKPSSRSSSARTPRTSLSATRPSTAMLWKLALDDGQYCYNSCCCPRGKSLSPRINLQVLVLGPQVLENCQELHILQIVRYVWSREVHLTCAVPGYYSQCWSVTTSTIVKRRWHVLRMLSGAIPSTWALAFINLVTATVHKNAVKNGSAYWWQILLTDIFKLVSHSSL